MVKEINQSPNVVEVQSWAESHVEGLDLQRGKAPQPGLRVEADAKHAVHDLLKRCAGMPRFGAQLSGNIVIQRESRSHILMLARRGRDVKNGVR